jgi:5-methyltetrahydrofolate--homocysteine methyltransferase
VDLLDLLERGKPILLDGAMGTELARRGLEMGGQNTTEAPDAVLEIHREYAKCGIDALITNTLTMNRIYLETHNVGVDVAEVNRKGVELARAAAGENLLVLGDMSSTGQLLEPYGDYTEEQFSDTFKEQAAILAEGGADAFIIETMLDLREALCALRACKTNSKLPVIASMAFMTDQNGGRTVMGNSAEECAKQLTDSGADVIGANCGEIDPTQMARVVSIMTNATSLPILAQPNAGKPRLVENTTRFDMAPGPFASGVLECIRAGASIVGGCCGTSPAHIRALARALSTDRKT